MEENKLPYIKVHFMQNPVTMLFVHFGFASLFLLFKNINLYLRILLWISFQLILFVQYKNVIFEKDKVYFKYILPLKKDFVIEYQSIIKVDLGEVTGQLISGYVLIIKMHSRKINIEISSNNVDLLIKTLELLIEKNVVLSTRARKIYNRIS